ncbi:hypothetical protein PtrM4_054550 [Pyrenophora tritici-repentis]|uniref:Uncharacterized protein n=1 Tax=Pyrenophora tritici-repentis TaxID=45151 RepID=A0A834RKY8_9PLEO|nr:hypothetical protein PtrM4_054550 [Pyrenophora tritici-repentis]
MNLALELGTGEGLQVASDASFADNTLDRKSSQGYAIKLFGGLISWRASKQDTVTTSTTEAELLALSQVAKEAIFTSRLLRELRVTLSDPTITIKCDNQQTIRLVTEDTGSQSHCQPINGPGSLINWDSSSAKKPRSEIELKEVQEQLEGLIM